ncbi:reverse transcriptase domain-containing protein [Tanacetum coccineum]
MILKFLSKYYPYSRALQPRKDILNFRQLPTESVFEAWERFKSCLQKCHDHRILLDHQILTFYHGITMIDRDKIMVVAGGNIMHKTPQEAYDLIENMTQHHFYAQIEVLGKQTTYTIQSVQHQPGPGHPNTVYYLGSDESDEDEPSEVLHIQKPIHSLSGNPTPSFDSMVESLSPLLPLPSRIKSSGSTTSQSDHSLLTRNPAVLNVDHNPKRKSACLIISQMAYNILRHELALEQSQQGVSNDVLVNIEGVEE